MADVGRQFAIMKCENKTTTSNYLPSGYGLKSQVENKLDQWQSSGILVLKTPIKKAIINPNNAIASVKAKPNKV